tara:strand:+ start:164 stop:712 length:549 start_codon:yes stop_codon:yes gene_type:complete
MSTFAMKKKLKAEIAAAKKAGKSMQTVGKLQYKLNQISRDSKGNAIKDGSGNAIKTKTGVVRQKPVKKTVTPKQKKKYDALYAEAAALGKPKAKAVVKPKPKGKMSDLVYDKPKSNVTVTPYPTAKIKKIDVSQAVNRDQARGNKVDVTKMPTSQAVTRKQARGSRVDVTKGGSVVKKRNKK